MLGADYGITLYHKVRAGREDEYRRCYINGVCLTAEEGIIVSDRQSVKQNSFVIRIPQAVIPKNFEISCGDIILRGETPEVSGKSELLRLGNNLTVVKIKDNRKGGNLSHIKVVCV